MLRPSPLVVGHHNGDSARGAECRHCGARGIRHAAGRLDSASSDLKKQGDRSDPTRAGTLLAATALGSVLAASIGVPQAQAHRFNRLESLLRETVTLI
jgi:hypothetical protein